MWTEGSLVSPGRCAGGQVGHLQTEITLLDVVVGRFLPGNNFLRENFRLEIFA